MNKEKLSNRFLAHTIFTLTLIVSSTTALAINKCTSNNGVTYTNLPCPKGENSASFSSQIIPPNDPEAARQRYLSDQKNLDKINQQKIKEEIQQKRDAHALALQTKQFNEHEFKCKELDFKKKSAQQHLAEVQIKRNGKATHKAHGQLKQASDKYVHYCKPG